MDWYQKNKRDLPWRGTNDPYRIWLSEIILQQTRIKQGMPYYREFVERFPTVHDLANAEESTVLRTWQGLGYYSRARNLHKCARMVVRDYRGKFPSTYAELIKLPGIGPYTAAAIASFAFDEKVAVLDGNVIRVLTRYFGVHTDVTSSKGIKELQKLAQLNLPDHHTQDYNQGIMEFGALQCTPGIPDCENCPMFLDCRARIEGSQGILPLKLTKTRVKQVHFTYFVLQRENRIWMNERKDGIWQGLYDFLLVEEDIRDPEDWLGTHLPVREFDLGHIRVKEHVLTHRRIMAKFVSVHVPAGVHFDFPEKNGKFFDLEEIRSLPKPILIDWYLDGNTEMNKAVN